MADAPQMNPIYTGLTQTDPNATGLGSMPIANMQPNQLAAMLFGMSQAANQAAQPSPYRQSPMMGLTSALQGASSGLGNYTSAQMAQQQFQIQAAKAAAEARTAQIGAASATRDYNLTNAALADPDLGVPGNVAPGVAPTTGSPGAGSPAGGSVGGAPSSSAGSSGGGSAGDSSAQSGTTSPTIGGDITNPAPHVVSAFHSGIGNTNDPAQLEILAQRAFLIGGDKFTKIAEMARDKAKDIRQSALTTGRSLDARGQPMVSPQAATALATTAGATKAGENQQTPTYVMTPNGPAIGGLTQIAGSTQGIQQRAFAQGYGDQSGKDTSTIQTGGRIANDKALGETYGKVGLTLPTPQVGSMGPGGTPPAASRVAAPAPIVAPAIHDPGIVAPTNAPAAPDAPGVPQVGTMGASPAAGPGGVPGVVAPGAAPGPGPAAPQQALLDATRSMASANAAPSIKTIYNPETGEYGTVDTAHAPMPTGFIETAESQLPPSIKGQIAADTEVRKQASNDQAAIGRQSNVLDTALALQNDPSFKSGRWQDLSMSARSFLSGFGFGADTVNTQQAYQAALARLTFQEAPTLNVQTVRPQMLGIMKEVQGELASNPNANKAAVLIGKSMADWDLNRIKAVTGSANATKAEGEYISKTPVMTPQLDAAVQNTLHSEKFTVPKFKGETAADDAMQWYTKYSTYWSVGQKQQFRAVMDNLGKNMNITGQTFKIEGQQ